MHILSMSLQNTPNKHLLTPLDLSLSVLSVTYRWSWKTLETWQSGPSFVSLKWKNGEINSVVPALNCSYLEMCVLEQKFCIVIQIS